MDQPDMKARTPEANDCGFTLVEMVVVMVLLGVFATVVVSAVFNFRDDTEMNTCDTDARTLQTAAEAYKAQNAVRLLPETGVGLDRYEVTLVRDGLLRSTSSLFDLDEDGMLVLVDGSPCAIG